MKLEFQTINVLKYFNTWQKCLSADLPFHLLQALVLDVSNHNGEKQQKNHHQ